MHAFGEVSAEINVARLLHDRLRQEVDQGDARISAIGYAEAAHDRLAINVLEHGPRIDSERVFAVFPNDRLGVVLGQLRWQRHCAKRGMEERWYRILVLNAEKAVNV